MNSSGMALGSMIVGKYDCSAQVCASSVVDEKFTGIGQTVPKDVSGQGENRHRRGRDSRQMHANTAKDTSEFVCLTQYLFGTPSFLVDFVSHSTTTSVYLFNFLVLQIGSGLLELVWWKMNHA